MESWFVIWDDLLHLFAIVCLVNLKIGHINPKPAAVPERYTTWNNIMTKKLFMKNTFVILSFFLISIVCKASDTISVWHVYYNKIKIKEYNQFNNNAPLIIKLTDYKIGDSITVKYLSDTKCHDCLTGIMVRSKDNRVTMAGKSVGRGNPISFPVSYLIDPKRKKKNFAILYLDSNGENATSTLLFEIEIN